MTGGEKEEKGKERKRYIKQKDRQRKCKKIEKVSVDTNVHHTIKKDGDRQREKKDEIDRENVMCVKEVKTENDRKKK